MSRPDPIQYAERLYSAIRAANFSPISFLAFGNAVKEGVELRRMPRIAAEPFMRIVGEMLDLEDSVEGDVIDADLVPGSALEAAAAESVTPPDAVVEKAPQPTAAVPSADAGHQPQGSRSNGPQTGS